MRKIEPFFERRRSEESDGELRGGFRTVDEHSQLVENAGREILRVVDENNSALLRGVFKIIKRHETQFRFVDADESLGLAEPEEQLLKKRLDGEFSRRRDDRHEIVVSEVRRDYARQQRLTDPRFSNDERDPLASFKTSRYVAPRLLDDRSGKINASVWRRQERSLNILIFAKFRHDAILYVPPLRRRVTIRACSRRSYFLADRNSPCPSLRRSPFRYLTNLEKLL